MLGCRYVRGGVQQLMGMCVCVVLCSVAQQDKGKTVTFASDDLVLHYGGGGLSRHYHRRNKSTPTIHHQQQYQHHQLGLLQQQRMTHPPPRHHYRKRKWCCSIATHSRLTQNYDDRYPLFRDCYISTSAAIYFLFIIFVSHSLSDGLDDGLHNFVYLIFQISYT